MMLSYLLATNWILDVRLINLCISTHLFLLNSKQNWNSEFSLECLNKIKGKGEKRLQVIRYFLSFCAWVPLWATSGSQTMILSHTPNNHLAPLHLFSCLLSSSWWTVWSSHSSVPFCIIQPWTSPTVLLSEYSLLMANLLQINFRMREGNRRKERKEASQTGELKGIFFFLFL